MKGAASESVGNSSRAEMSQMDVSEPQLPTSPLIISREKKTKKKKRVCRALARGGSLLSSSRSTAGEKTQKHLFWFFESAVRNKYRKIERQADVMAVISPRRTWRYCRWPRTKPRPGSSGVIGNCRCKRAISEASSAFSSGEEYIHRSDDARRTLRPAAAQPVNLFQEGSARAQ